MFKRIFLFRDRLVIWAILRFGFRVPSLQQALSVSSGDIFYYYGRWLRVVPQTPEVRRFISETLRAHQVVDRVPDHVGAMLPVRMCQLCALHRLGLPCRKFSGGTVHDACFSYRFMLIKGKQNDEEIESE